MRQRTHEGRHFASTAKSGRRWLKFAPPRWYVRWRLALANREIDRVERQLADEFALVETAAIHQELEALLAERHRLLTQIADWR